MGLSSNKKSKVMKEVEEDTIKIPTQVWISFNRFENMKTNIRPGSPISRLFLSSDIMYTNSQYGLKRNAYSSENADSHVAVR